MVVTLQNGKTNVAVCFQIMPAGMRQIVTIQGQREKTGITYWVDLLPSDFGTAVRFDKVFEAGTEDRPESYDVLLGGGNYSCECKGFLRHGHCKHGIAARQMIDAGALEAVAPARRGLRDSGQGREARAVVWPLQRRTGRLLLLLLDLRQGWLTRAGTPTVEGHAMKTFTFQFSQTVELICTVRVRAKSRRQARRKYHAKIDSGATDAPVIIKCGGTWRVAGEDGPPAPNGR